MLTLFPFPQSETGFRLRFKCVANALSFTQDHFVSALASSTSFPTIVLSSVYVTHTHTHVLSDGLSEDKHICCYG